MGAKSFWRLPPRMSVVGSTIWQSVILPWSRLKQLFGTLRGISNIPFRAIEPRRSTLKVICLRLPLRLRDGYKPQCQPLISRVVSDVFVRQPSRADANAPTPLEIVKMLLPRHLVFNAFALFGVPFCLGCSSTLSIDRLDVLFSPRACLLKAIEHRGGVPIRRAPSAIYSLAELPLLDVPMFLFPLNGSPILDAIDLNHEKSPRLQEDHTPDIPVHIGSTHGSDTPAISPKHNPWTPSHRRFDEPLQTVLADEL